MADRPAFAPDAAGRLLLTTLGGTGLARPGTPPAAVLGPGKPLALLTYLALSPGRSATRDHLLDLLWADLAPEPGRHTLRQTIWSVRRRLGEHALAMNGDGQLTLAIPVECDRDAFLAAIDAGDGECAVTLYRGEFLPGFAAPGGAAFEHWADAERFRLRLLFLRTGEDVVRQRLARARFREAQSLARRLRDADPARESAWRLLIESLLAGGDRIGATVEADALSRALSDDEREPEPATRAILRLVTEEPVDAAEPTGGARRLVAELIGRDAQFAAVMEAWDGARRGAGRHVHVATSAGMGKTRLLGDVFARLRAQGARALLVRANPGERHVEYALAADLAAALCAMPGAAGVSPATAGTLVALNPVLSSRYAQASDRAAAGEALRRRAIALCETVAAISDEAPLALLLDDLHWADQASRVVLQTILDRLPGSRVLAFTATRPSPDAAFTTTATRALTLDPLSPDEVGAVVVSLGALPDAPWAARLPMALHSATGGSPLLVLDTLHWLIERQLLTRGSEGWACRDSDALARELATGSALRRRVADLDRKPGWVLLLLAELGTPVPVDRLAQIAGLAPGELTAQLAALEQKGLAARAGEEWQPAHDEIAAAAHDDASTEARRAANAAVGRVLAEVAGEDAPLLFKAGRHLAAGGEDTELERVFRVWVPVVRRRGERRGLRQLATDLVGNGGAPQRVAHLVRSLPSYVRLGLTSPARIAAAVIAPLVLAGAAAALALRPAPPPPDAVLVVVRQAGGDSLRAVTVPLRRESWEVAQPIDVARAGRPYPVLARAGGYAHIAPSADGARWAFARLASDSEGMKLFVVDRAGVPDRVTDSIRDDRELSWSPDGKYLVFATERWDSNRWTDLAILEVATGRVRRLTDGPASDQTPQWSPDGTRIAFQRHSQRTGTSTLCWTTPEPGSPRCLPQFTTGDLLGWYDAQHVLTKYDSAGETVLSRIDIDSRTAAVIWHGRDRGRVSLSPDAGWIACFCQPQGLAEPAWLVWPIDRPDLARRVAVGTDRDPPHVILLWNGVRGSAFLDRLEILSPSDTIPAGVPYRLRAQGRDSAGHAVAVPVVTWHSLDTAIATVNEVTGTVHGKRAGEVVLVASAGGWRTGQEALLIEPPRYEVVLAEDWTDGLDAWSLFGDPTPSVVRGPGGVSAYWNQGDGWWVSGAYSSRTVVATTGIGLEARLSTPVIGPRQQLVHLWFGAWPDSILERWDDRSGSRPDPAVTCEVSYPPGSGDWLDGRRELHFGGRVVRVAPVMWSGQWWTVRLQLFPDGRCGLAVNGVAVAIANNPITLDRPFRVVLDGNSLGNRMLVGPLEVWQGVKGGVDWWRAETRPAP